MKKRTCIVDYILIVVLVTFISMFLYGENNNLVTTELTYTNSRIPKNFDGYRIVQLSDLHNKQFGKNQSALISEIKKAKPNLLVLTGDMIDGRKTNMAISLQLTKQLCDIAPVYYVSGNHEKISGIYDEFKCRLQEDGIVVLDNEKADIEMSNQYITLAGLQDVGFYAYRFAEEDAWHKELKSHLSSLLQKSDHFTLVLSHRPELLPEYAACKAELVFCGHAHGGQIELPLIGGLIAPGQGLFPEHTKGSCVFSDTTMIISRGLGNSLFPLRIFNRPELVVLELKSK